MIGKVLRGADVGGLLRYLYSPGRHNEHLSPRLVAGWDDVERIEPPVTAAGHRDFRRLTDLLDAPPRAAGLTTAAKPVYHLVVSSARADPARGLDPDRPLRDTEWRDIAADLIKRIGLATPHGEGVRWVAIRHDQPGSEHVHIMATLATETGQRVHPRNDYYRLGEGCRAAENRYGLRRTGARDRTADKRSTRAEQEKASRRGWKEPTRTLLRHEVRAAVTEATTIDGFLDRLRSAGLLVRERRSQRDGAITGYAVAVPDRTDPGGTPIFYCGGSLAADLTIPKLSARWRPADQPTPAPGMAAGERDRVWQHALGAARAATAAITAHDTDPGAAADAAWSAADLFGSAARLLNGHRGTALQRAAEQYERTAREAWGRIPPPSAAGGRVRTAARLLAATRLAHNSEMRQLLALLTQLAALTDAVTRMREAQDRVAQAAASRRAAENLRAARRDLAPPAQPDPLDRRLDLTTSTDQMRGRAR